MNFLKAQNFLTYTKGQVQERIKELNDGETSHQVKNYNNSKAEKKTVRVWSVPEFKEPIDIPGINVGGEEIPF